MNSPPDNEAIQRILSLRGDDRDWRADFERLQRGDTTLTRQSAGESAIKAVQRLLIFLGYSTASTGAFIIDGDFGRGTNRGVAQFQFEQGLNPQLARTALCYPCTSITARSRIVSVPDVTLDVLTLEKLVGIAVDSIAEARIPFRNFEDALFHLNSLQQGRTLNCRQILERYGAAVQAAIGQVRQERQVDIQPEWILAIVRQETAGIARPRFEQHKLSKLNTDRPRDDFAELRIRSMSIGLGQIMGLNYERVGAPSAAAMLYSPAAEQVLYVARFIAARKNVVSNRNPAPDDFRTMARYYNGPGYEKNFYHERLQRWFREFRLLSEQA